MKIDNLFILMADIQRAAEAGDQAKCDRIKVEALTQLLEKLPPVLGLTPFAPVIDAVLSFLKFGTEPVVESPESPLKNPKSDAMQDLANTVYEIVAPGSTRKKK